MGNDNDHKVPEELRARPRTLSYISVYTPPTKTTYFEGELFDTTGMVIKAYYSDFTNEVVNLYVYAPQTALTTSDTFITITYNGKTTTQSITVNPILTSISIYQAPYKTTYLVGDQFEPYGMIVKAYYSNSTSQTITNYSFSNNPLTINDNQITITYQSKTTTQTISVNNPPISGYYPVQNIKESNIGNNPYFNLFDQSIRFISNAVSVSREAYELSFNLVYHSRMQDKLSALISGLPKRFKTNYHQFLIKDGKDSGNNDIYKYIDAEGYIHSFYKVLTDLYYCATSNLYLVFYEENNQSFSKIVDESNNSLIFNDSGYLITIIQEPTSGNSNIININYINGRISSVLNELDEDTEITFNYDNQNRLVTINFLYHNTLAKSLSLNYSSANLLTGVTETANNETKSLYSFLYSAGFDRVVYIKDHISDISYSVSCEFNQNLNDCIANALRIGYFNTQNIFTEKESIEVSSISFRNDNSNTIYEVLVQNYNELYFLYSLDKNAKITASFESDANKQTLKTLYKESGHYLDIDGDLAVSINSHQFKSVPTNGLSITLSNSVINSFNAYTNFVLRIYVRINSNSNNRIKAILTSSYISSDTVDLNVDQSFGYQLIEIPFTKINNISSDSFNLSFKNENNQSVSVDIADVYFMINNKTTLKFLGGSYSFNDVTNIEIYNNYFDQTPTRTIDISWNNFFSIDDFLKSVNHLHNCFHLLFDGSHNPLYFNHGKIVDFYGFRFTLLVGSTTVFDSYLSNNSNLNSNDAWFLKTNSFNDIKCTKVYYRFNANDYEIITQETNSNDAVFIKAETKHYDYYNRLLSINHLHTNASGTFISTTYYEYFNNGELKKIYIKSGSETIILYHAEQNEQGFIYRKTIGKNSVDIDFANSYVEAIIKHNEVLGSEVVNTDYKKVLTYDAYQENLNGVAFSDDFDDYGSNEQNINLSNQEVTFTINNSNLYRLTQDVSNDTLTFKRYNGSSFDDVLSINKSIDLNQLTFFIDSSNSVIISQDIDIYGKILNEKLNNVNKVTYNYDSNGIESLTVLKNLTSVVDSYINKTTLFYFNGFDFYERSHLDNYFDIERLYNGYTQYCFTSDEIYIIDADTYLIETQINNIHCDNHSLKLAYDAFNRLIRKERFSNNTSVLVDSFTYKNNSFLPATYKHTFFSNSHLASENYNYDFYGNLASTNTLYQSSPYFSISVTYTYDDFNRISTESNILVGSLSHSYSYYTDGRMERIDNNVLSYNDKGQLSSFGTISYSYDHYGNRLTKTVNNQTEYYTYERGKLLHSLQKSIDDIVTFSYDYRGLRYQKDTNTETITYYYDNHKLIGEDHVGKNYDNVNYPSYKLRFFYDNNDIPTGFRYINSSDVKTDYAYIVNPFNQIIGITLYNANPYSLTVTLEAIYVYDAWGNHKVYNPDGTENTSLSFIGNINPLRYKSYYFDKETNLYYLISRYYDPSIGQFISPDDYSYLDINSISGYYLYAYCNNNPVMNYDPEGHGIVTLLAAGIIGALIGFGAAAINDFKEDQEWFNGRWQDYLFETGIGLASGLIGGAIGFLPKAGFFANLVANSLLGGTNSILSGVYYNELNSCSSLSEYALSFLKGAVIAGITYSVSYGIANLLAFSEYYKIIGKETSNHHINQKLLTAGIYKKIGEVGKYGIIKTIVKSNPYSILNDALNGCFDLLINMF